MRFGVCNTVYKFHKFTRHQPIHQFQFSSIVCSLSSLNLVVTLVVSETLHKFNLFGTIRKHKQTKSVVNAVEVNGEKKFWTIFIHLHLLCWRINCIHLPYQSFSKTGIVLCVWMPNGDKYYFIVIIFYLLYQICASRKKVFVAYDF